jgi:hypothetical protein
MNGVYCGEDSINVDTWKEAIACCGVAIDGIARSRSPRFEIEVCECGRDKEENAENWEWFIGYDDSSAQKDVVR